MEGQEKVGGGLGGGCLLTEPEVGGGRGGVCRGVLAADVEGGVLAADWGGRGAGGVLAAGVGVTCS